MPNKKDLISGTIDLQTLQAIQRETYRESFLEFIKGMWAFHHPHTPLKMNWHIEAIADHLQAQSKGQIQRLIINVPPGSSKSLLAGVYWPCWEWTWAPHRQMLAAAANLDLALKDNQRARWLLESPDYRDLFPLDLKQDSASNQKFTNDKMGFRVCAAFTGMTGLRGDHVIIDDPLMANDAESQTKREGVNKTFFNSITTRMNQPRSSTITIIQQRLHKQDLVGAILERDSRFETLIIPMEYVPRQYSTSIGWKDPRTKAGDLMFPDHWERDTVDAYKAQGPYYYASQFQQNPVPAEDGFFDTNKFKRYDPKILDGKNLHKYMTSDHAVGDKKKNDYNVVRVRGIDEEKNLYLLDSFRKQCLLKDAMGLATTRDGRLTIAKEGAMALIRKHKPLAWFAEPDNNFKGIKGMVEDTMLATNTFTSIVFATGHGSNKQSKAAAYQSMSLLGKIFLPIGVVGDEALLEYAEFGVGDHDDQVDADSILPRMINSAHASIAVPSEAPKPVSDYVGTSREDARDDSYGCWF